MAQGRMIQIKCLLEKKQETYLCERTHSRVCPPRSLFLERWLLALGRKCARGRRARGQSSDPGAGHSKFGICVCPQLWLLDDRVCYKCGSRICNCARTRQD